MTFRCAYNDRGAGGRHVAFCKKMKRRSGCKRTPSPGSRRKVLRQFLHKLACHPQVRRWRGVPNSKPKRGRASRRRNKITRPRDTRAQSWIAAWLAYTRIRGPRAAQNGLAFTVQGVIAQGAPRLSGTQAPPAVGTRQSSNRASSADAKRSPARRSKRGRAERAAIPTAVAGSAIDEVAISVATAIREGSRRRRPACPAGRTELRSCRPRRSRARPQQGIMPCR
jgi:hypothetical protein